MYIERSTYAINTYGTSHQASLSPLNTHRFSENTIHTSSASSSENSSFLNSVWHVITYPFVKFYEFLCCLFCCKKKEPPKDLRVEFFRQLGAKKGLLTAELMNECTHDQKLEDAYCEGLAFYTGKRELTLPKDWQKNPQILLQYLNGLMEAKKKS